MFKCERCGSGYSVSHVGVENCPRCMLLDRVQAPLALKVFKLPKSESSPSPAAMSQPVESSAPLARSAP